MENIEGCAYQQLWSWSDYSYKELAKTRTLWVIAIWQTPLTSV